MPRPLPRKLGRGRVRVVHGGRVDVHQRDVQQFGKQGDAGGFARGGRPLKTQTQRLVQGPREALGSQPCDEFGERVVLPDQLFPEAIQQRRAGQHAGESLLDFLAASGARSRTDAAQGFGAARRLPTYPASASTLGFPPRDQARTSRPATNGSSRSRSAGWAASSAWCASAANCSSIAGGMPPCRRPAAATANRTSSLNATLGTFLSTGRSGSPPPPWPPPNAACSSASEP